MEARIQISGNERGAVLITALFVLLLLTIIGIAATTTTTTDLQIAENQKIHSMAFYAAEAGIEAGRVLLNDLKRADIYNWSNLLAGDPLVGQDEDITTMNQVLDSAGGRTVGSPQCTFSLDVRDNDDDNPGDIPTPYEDLDDVIVLTSTGKCAMGFFNNVTVKIETQVRYTGGGGQYAQEHYGTDSSGVAAGESGTVAAEQRW